MEPQHHPNQRHYRLRLRSICGPSLLVFYLTVTTCRVLEMLLLVEREEIGGLCQCWVEEREVIGGLCIVLLEAIKMEFLTW